MTYRKPAEIIALLREAEASGESVADFCRRKGIVEQTLYRWRRRYGQLDQDEAKRLKTLAAENTKLKQLLAEAALANEALKELLAKKW